MSPRKNPMDIIKVSFGVSLTPEEQKLVSNPFGIVSDEDQKRVEELKSKVRVCSILEFIYPERYPNNKPLNLSESEKKVQEALRKIYELNDKDPPLYRKFPTFRLDNDPLMIDITTLGNTGKGAAAYNQKNNKITFKKADKLDFLFLTLVHELKHAEQCNKQLYLWTQKVYSAAMEMAFGNNHPMENAYVWHQLQFLSEAQAFFTNARAYYEVFGCPKDADNSVKIYAKIARKHTDSLGHRDDAKIEKEAIEAFLDILYDSPYKDTYDMIAPIGEKDKGLDHIPEVFHLPESLMKKLREAPRVARSLNGKLFQARRNDHIDEYIKLLLEGIKKKEDIQLDLEFVLGHATPKQLQKVLSLKKGDGKYLLETEKIRDKFININRQLDLSLESLKYLLSARRDEEKIITPQNIGLMLAVKAGYLPDSFNDTVSVLMDAKGHLPLTEKDVITEGLEGRILNNLLYHLSPISEKRLAIAVQMLPEILKLKGKDGNPLVADKQLIERLGGWFSCVPQNMEVLFNSIKDEKGNLPFSRQSFETEEGKNILLESLVTQTNPESIKQLPLLMSLKDKDGQPIISQENIEQFPKNNKLYSVVKAYERPKENVPSKLKSCFQRPSDRLEMRNPNLKPPLRRKTPQAEN